MALPMPTGRVHSWAGVGGTGRLVKNNWQAAALAVCLLQCQVGGEGLDTHACVSISNE